VKQNSELTDFMGKQEPVWHFYTIATYKKTSKAQSTNKCY